MVDLTMDINEKFLNNIISYFSEAKLTDQFKGVFLEEVKNDSEFQEKLKGMLESEGEARGDEALWKKIIDSDNNLLSKEMKEKVFRKFEEILHQIFQSTRSGNKSK